MNLQGNGLGTSSVKPRSKRSYHHGNSKKLSIKDLALELAKKHVSSINKLLDSTFSTYLNHGSYTFFTVAVSIQLKCFLSSSHLHLPYLLVSRPIFITCLEFTLPRPPQFNFSAVIIFHDP